MRPLSVLCVAFQLIALALSVHAKSWLNDVLSRKSSCEMTYMYSGYHEVPDHELSAPDQAPDSSSSRATSVNHAYKLYRYIDTSLDAGAMFVTHT